MCFWNKQDPHAGSSHVALSTARIDQCQRRFQTLPRVKIFGKSGRWLLMDTGRGSPAAGAGGGGEGGVAGELPQEAGRRDGGPRAPASAAGEGVARCGDRASDAAAARGQPGGDRPVPARRRPARHVST